MRIVVEGREPGPTLLMASHLDTVPPGDGWSVPPYAGVVDDGRLMARGAVDAKASVSAMAAAAAELRARGGPAAGRLVVLATYSEETRDTSMPSALERLGEAPDAAIVGEPTSLQPCVAQRGQLLLELHWEGDQVHAGWAAGRQPPPVNAINRAADDLDSPGQPRLRSHPPDARSGGGDPDPTRSRGRPQRHSAHVLGHARHPDHPGLRARRGGRDDPRSRRCPGRDLLGPAGARPDAGRFETARGGDGGPTRSFPFASPTCSDWVFLRHLDTVKLGPGNSQQSHTADEWIELDEVRAAAQLYAAVAGEYLK